MVPAGGNTGSFTFIYNRGPGTVGAYEIGFYLSADTVFSAGTDAFLGLVSGSNLTPNAGCCIQAEGLPTACMQHRTFAALFV